MAPGHHRGRAAVADLPLDPIITSSHRHIVGDQTAGMLTSDSPSRSTSQDTQLLATLGLRSDPREHRDGRQVSISAYLEDPGHIGLGDEAGKCRLFAHLGDASSGYLQEA